jgi:hypothetical protein
VQPSMVAFGHEACSGSRQVAAEGEIAGACPGGEYVEMGIDYTPREDADGQAEGSQGNQQ